MILLVDDEPEIRAAAATILRQEGYAVVEVAEPDEALVALEAHPEIDLLVTDIVMPRGSGIALGQDAVAARPALRVVYVSGWDEPLGYRRTQLNGALLAKPFRATELIRSVKRALAA